MRQAGGGLESSGQAIGTGRGKKSAITPFDLVFFLMIVAATGGTWDRLAYIIYQDTSKASGLEKMCDKHIVCVATAAYNAWVARHRLMC